MDDRFQCEEILIVDDAPANLRLLSQVLTRRGYRVRAATGGQRALDSVAARRPDLILLDIRMNGMSGFDVCDRLKSAPRTRDIPVIFISALTELEDKVRAFAVGGVDYITKPFHVEEVLARVETHLALRRLQLRLVEANRRFARELALANKVQCSFLPVALPQPAGWLLAATLRPAREMSGDFYDAFPLPNGCIALVMADVVDKGIAAALFMALSWSLLRTYAFEFPEHPAQVLAAVNHRLLQDAHADQFVTVFYGVLDPIRGLLTYGNAGHCPALRVTAADWTLLPNCGLPLGLLEEGQWEQRTVTLPPGATLVLYTDGITEAQNAGGVFFDLTRLRQAVLRAAGCPAPTLLQELMADVHRFLGDSPLLDDVALMVLTRV